MNRPAGAAAFASAVFLYEGVAKLTSVFPARRLHRGLRANRWVYGATGLSVALQVACVGFQPLRQLLGLSPLSLELLVTVSAALLLTLIGSELIVYFLRREPRAHRSETALAQ